MRTDLYQDMYETESAHWWHLAKRELVLSFLSEIKTGENPLKILDVGCGTGKNLEAFSRFGDAWGVDPAEEALQFCKKRNTIQVKEARADSLPFSDESFDVVTLLDVLEHIDEHPSLDEAWRVLKKGGRLIVTVPAYMWLWSGWDVALHHKRRYTHSSLKNAVSSVGFTLHKLTYAYSFLVAPAFFMRRLKKQSGDYTSDFQVGNSVTNYICSGLAALERFLIRKISIPFGTSVVCVAQKPLS